jgi:hypothetical protein
MQGACYGGRGVRELYVKFAWQRFLRATRHRPRRDLPADRQKQLWRRRKRVILSTGSELVRWLESEIERIQRGGKTPVGWAPLFDAGSGVLYLRARAVCLEANEQDVLGALVERTATTLQVLKKASDCDNPSRVLKGLVKKYPELKKHIVLPGRKGQGGYSTTIRFGAPETI